MGAREWITRTCAEAGFGQKFVASTVEEALACATREPTLKIPYQVEKTGDCGTISDT